MAVQMLQEGYDTEFTVAGNSMWPLVTHERDCVPLQQSDIQTQQLPLAGTVSG